MKNSIQSTSSLEWEINEIQYKQKKNIYHLEKIIPAMFVLLLIFPPFGFFLILIAIIIFTNLKQNNNIKQKESAILEKYKIDESGITINNLKENKKSFFSWNELSSFYSYSKINPVMGFIISKIAGDDFFIVNKNNKRIKLSAGNNDTSKVKYMLFRKLKFKSPTSAQATSSMSNSIFKIKYSGIGLFDNWLSTPSSSNNKQNNIGFVNSKQEKQFHEQTIAQRGNLQKEKEAFKKKILIVSYIVIMFIVTIIYLIFDKN